MTDANSGEIDTYDDVSMVTQCYILYYTGDYESAVDTLKMAVSLIKQSITASSDASQVRVFYSD